VRSILLVGLLTLGTCRANTGPADPQAVLFIGNSLFAVNDLPAMVAALAASDGMSLRVASDVVGGTALIDHVTAGDGPSAIARQHWDIVVMQQGPTTYAVCHDTLVLALQQLAPAIRAAGARPAVFMSWPAASDTAGGTFEIVRGSFQSGAAAVDALFIPAGAAWPIAWAQDPTLGLYGKDGYHPAPLGTFLSALVVYERITGRDARSLPPQVPLMQTAVPRATIILLQRAAHEANQRFGAGLVPGRPLRQGSLSSC
jgi:hypothetical protein